MSKTSRNGYKFSGSPRVRITLLSMSLLVGIFLFCLTILPVGATIKPTSSTTLTDSSWITLNATPDDPSPTPTPPSGNVISINPNVSHQTFRGWDATAQAGQWDFPDYAIYKNVLADMASAAGISSLRLHIRSNYESTATPWTALNPPVNDNADPYSINAAGFNWTNLDAFADFVDLMKARAAAKGETIFVTLNFSTNDEVTIHSTNPEEYAELIEAACVHLNTRFGWVPDAIEVVNEPSQLISVWTAPMVANSILATQSRLAGYGWHPVFFAPSVENPTDTVTGITISSLRVQQPQVTFQK